MLPETGLPSQFRTKLREPQCGGDDRHSSDTVVEDCRTQRHLSVLKLLSDFLCLSRSPVLLVCEDHPHRHEIENDQC